MELNGRQAQIIESLYGLHLNLARGDDDARRDLTTMIAEQFCFEFGNDWGCKAQTSNHPRSKDSLAFRLNSQTMHVWDWQNGTTREPQVGNGSAPTYPDLMGHYFIPVSPINHLADEPDNGDDPVIVLLSEMNVSLRQIRDNQAVFAVTQAQILENQAKMLEILQVILDKPPVEVPPIAFPEYKGRVLGFDIILRPQPK